MEAKKYLERIKKIDLIMENKQAERDKWFEIATGITANMSGERVQTSGNPHRMEDAWCSYAMAGEEYDAIVIALKREKDEIIHTIEELPPTEYDLLHKVYVQGMSLKEYAVVKDVAYSSVTAAHGNALRLLQLILDSQKP
jgi:DNA-directed RNA polymerase specialized sigma24 family protein